jgi:Right handed beta helix region
VRAPAPIAGLALAALVFVSWSGVPRLGTGAGEAACPASNQACIYVSPSGNDTNPGTRSAPLQTLAHARDLVRGLDHDMTGDISVVLEGGAYRLTAPLQLGPQDSGTNGHDVIWTATSGATAVVSGADQITGWTLSDPSKGIWAAPVRGNLKTRQVYVDGVRAWPAWGRVHFELSLFGTGYGGGYTAPTPVMSHWRNPSEIEFVFTGQDGSMTETICPVKSIHGKAIYMAQPCWYNSRFRHPNLVGSSWISSPTYVENAYELLDQPGEFYLDDHLHVLYYIPRPGQDMSTADIEAPALPTLISGQGTAQHPIHNITFQNLQLSHATWMQPSSPQGFSEIQMGYTLTGKDASQKQGLCHLVPHGTCPYGAWTKEPGNIQFSYDRSISFVNDRFLHLGAAALNLDNGSQNDLVQGSVFTDISGNGIELGGVNMPEARPDARTVGNQILDNHLYGMPVEFHGGVPIIVGYAANTTISHNQIDHVSYAGISVGWGGWLDKAAKPPVANNSQDNIVSDNLIYDYMQTLVDGGGIYTQGLTGTSMANGEKVTGNVIHDQLDWGSAMKSDDGATYVTYSGNALWNNIYDSGSLHWDNRNGCPIAFARTASTTPVSCHWDATLVKDNWWQQGDPKSWWSWAKGYTETGNRLITGPRDVPASVLRNAGLEPAYRSLLTWQPRDPSPPDPPELVSILYAFHDKVYVTFHPSYVEGTSPITSYLVEACRVLYDGQCSDTPAQFVTISSSGLASAGYAVVSGLKGGVYYRITVTALNAAGASVQSVPTPKFLLGTSSPPLPQKPTTPWLQLQGSVVAISWYRPPATGTRRLVAGSSDRPAAVEAASRWSFLPVLGYVVESSDGQSDSVSGHLDLISTNCGGKVVAVIGGLRPKVRYKFAIVAVNPSGSGPATYSAAVTPK